MSPLESPKVAHAPFYEDPIHQGPADPRLFKDPRDGSWWILYTSRRATLESKGVAWGFGTDIGIAHSTDQGKNWKYYGSLDLKVQNENETFWGPEIVFHDGLFHLFPAYCAEVSEVWDVKSQPLAHFTSSDFKSWNFEGFLPLEAEKIIEGSVLKMPNGEWRIWYRRDLHYEESSTWTPHSGSMTTWCARSDNLFNWTILGQAVGDIPHEGATVFKLGEFYWMLVDAWCGLGVYRSKDADTWIRQEGFVLETGGQRKDDQARAHNASVCVIGDQAQIIYHTHPEEKDYDELWSDGAPFSLRRSVLQVAVARVEGETLLVVRNKAPLLLS